MYKRKFNNKIWVVSRLTGIDVRQLKDRAVKSFIEECIDEYYLPEILNRGKENRKKESCIRYTCDKLNWSRIYFNYRMYKWWLGGYQYFYRDLIGRFEPDLNKCKVYNGVVRWFDEKISKKLYIEDYVDNDGVKGSMVDNYKPVEYQLVLIKCRLCRVGVGTLYAVYGKV